MSKDIFNFRLFEDFYTVDPTIFSFRRVNEKYQEFTKKDPDHSKYKVMAAVVMTTGIPLTNTAKSESLHKIYVYILQTVVLFG